MSKRGSRSMPRKASVERMFIKLATQKPSMKTIVRDRNGSLRHIATKR